jgi:F-type H+-transporting ATPase subunit a
MIFAAGSALDHVMDTYDWHLLDSMSHVSLRLFGYEVVSKYAILMMIAAGLILLIYLPLAKKIQTGEAPTGGFWNLFEAILTFIRDNIAKPYIGKDADLYVGYLWTVFLFVLFCNLLGMLPFMGSPTASFMVTSVLAFSVFIFIHVSSIMKVGLKYHLLAFAPHMDIPFAMKCAILPAMWVIEFVGLVIKCVVLSVRLFANMFAGHVVLATILLFIPMAANLGEPLEGTIIGASVLGVLALSFLELFVAFLQAFLFAFLTALFLGGILEHAEHAAHAGAEHGHGGEDGHHGHVVAPGHTH